MHDRPGATAEQIAATFRGDDALVVLDRLTDVGEQLDVTITVRTGGTDPSAADIPVGPHNAISASSIDALTTAGIVLGEHGHRDEAVSALQEARLLATAVSATGEVAKIDALLRDLGAIAFRPRKGRGASGWEALTDSEQRIAPLVADGLTYREVGERLFISRRTVETHVASIFRKLGVTSRGEFTRLYFEQTVVTA